MEDTQRYEWRKLRDMSGGNSEILVGKLIDMSGGNSEI